MPRLSFINAAAAALFIFGPNAGAADDAPATAGKKIFNETAKPTCAMCHALKDAGATSEIGPNLDELKADADRIAKAVRDGIGIMPAFAETLTDAQIKAVADYVAKATGAVK